MTRQAPVATQEPPKKPAAVAQICDVCGSADVRELKCKVTCRNCKTILQSCADL